MAEHGTTHIRKDAFADLVHEGCSQIASGGQYQRDHSRADHRPVQQLGVLPAEPLVDEIGEAAPHGQQCAGHHQQRQGRAGDAPAIRPEERPEDAQQLGRGIGRAAFARRCRPTVDRGIAGGTE